MAHRFKRRKGRFVARLDSDERALLVTLFEQAHQIVEPPSRGGTPSRSGPASGATPTGDMFTDMMARSGFFADEGAEGAEQVEDPALQRLVPPGHRDDAEAAREFRHLTAYSIRDTKASRLQVAITAIKEAADDVSLSAADAEALLAALTDVRLILADRLGLQTDEDADAISDIPPDDPLGALALYYDFLTWLQESLAEALLRR
jgi:Domain of unknown function (DUF2017)